MSWSLSVLIRHPTQKKPQPTIPVVFALVPDPLGSKLVKSLARPEANVTGLSNTAFDLIGKRLELLKEVMPVVARGVAGQCQFATRIDVH